MSTRKAYTRESLERALIHHRARWAFRPNEYRPWLVETKGGDRPMTDSEVYAYVAGLADMRTAFELGKIVLTDSGVSQFAQGRML